MNWDYRVTRTRVEHGDVYDIREVHYNNDRVVGWTVEPGDPFGESVDDLRADLRRMCLALDRPVLDITDESNPTEVAE